MSRVNARFSVVLVRGCICRVARSDRYALVVEALLGCPTRGAITAIQVAAPPEPGSPHTVLLNPVQLILYS